ncbi:type IV toxin-antitoxin system AbiEi family antitoxin [Leifsonia sp. fls2-241-R2A-40a]|uniref:type IV toxin-antitoxin system AbiEi family antitoxin n=1 Tax=Leifsonia sp. fls2-241-R2A-40a TaxID=3040290 RepID=UPI00254D3A04|nr:type IV toxin-antitoxin system AbiEi family antitoxin [Leifsonia sp. fls2-241-R2A-40a]
MTSISPPLLDAGILPVVELLALCLDGHLFRVGDAFATVDTPDGPALRAQGFARSAPGWAVADRGSAAWIHGTRSVPPPVPQVCVPPNRRGGVRSPSVDTSHRALAAGDTMAFGGVIVTTPVRTAVDLLSTSPTFDEAEALEVRHLLALAAVTPAELDELLRASRRKGCGVARSRMPAVARATLPGLKAESPVSRR